MMTTWTGDAGGAAQRDREEAVDEPYRGEQWSVRVEPFGPAPAQQSLRQRAPDRPALRQVQRARAAVVAPDGADLCLHVAAATFHPFEPDRAGFVERDADVVLQPSLHDAAYRVAGQQPGAFAHRRFERPQPVGQRCRHVTARQEHAVFGGQRVERALQAVEHLAEQTGPQRDRQQFAAQFDRVAHAHAARVLEHLQIGQPPAHAQHLGFQPRVARAHVGDLVLRDRSVVELDGDQIRPDRDHGGPGALPACGVRRVHEHAPASGCAGQAAWTSACKRARAAVSFWRRRSCSIFQRRRYASTAA